MNLEAKNQLGTFGWWNPLKSTPWSETETLHAPSGRTSWMAECGWSAPAMVSMGRGHNICGRHLFGFGCLKFGKGSHLRNGRITRDNSHLICGYAGQHSSTLFLVLSTSRTSSSGCSWWRTLAKSGSGPTLVLAHGNHWQVPQHQSALQKWTATNLFAAKQPWERGALLELLDVACCTRQHPRNGLCLSCLGWFPRTSVQPPFFAAVLCSVARASAADCGACGASAAAGRVSWVIEVPKTFSLTSHWPFFSSAFSWSFFMPFFLMA